MPGTGPGTELVFDKYLDGRMDERTDGGRDDGLNDGTAGSSFEVKPGVGLLRDWITQVPLPQYTVLLISNLYFIFFIVHTKIYWPP